MKNVVWKFILSPIITLQLPKGAKTLSVNRQGDDICLWVQCDPTQEVEARTFKAIPTGVEFEFSDDHVFVGTVLINKMVFHIYERIPRL